MAMDNNKKENELNYQLPERSWVQFIILRVVCEDPNYGYKIIEKIEEITQGAHKVKTGTVYTVLRRMQEKGLLKSNWKESTNGPNKRIYQPTKKGEKQLKVWLEMIIERKPMIDNMVNFYNKHFKNED